MRALRLWAATAGIGTLLCAGTAFADAPPPSYPPPYAPVYAPTLAYDWTGVYVGGHVGGAVTKNNWTYTNGPLVDVLEQSSTGFAGGGHVGLQKQWGTLVLGAEAVYTWMDQKETSGSIAPDVSLTGTAKSVLLVTGKLGVAWDNILAYSKAGWATSDVDYRTSTTSTGAPLTSSSARHQGWTAGVGLEYAVWNYIILGVEYDYVKFNVGSRLQVPAAGGPVGTTVTEAGVDTQTVTARLSFKFGGARPEPEPIPTK
jgi:outer membrane immunogenic protein